MAHFAKWGIRLKNSQKANFASLAHDFGTHKNRLSFFFDSLFHKSFLHQGYFLFSKSMMMTVNNNPVLTLRVSPHVIAAAKGNCFILFLVKPSSPTHYAFLNQRSVNIIASILLLYIYSKQRRSFFSA